VKKAMSEESLSELMAAIAAAVEAYLEEEQASSDNVD
jgi:hypothetical protein